MFSWDFLKQIKVDGILYFVENYVVFLTFNLKYYLNKALLVMDARWI